MYLGFLPLASAFYLIGNAMYWLESCNTTFEENGVWIFIGEVMSCSPWTFIMSLQVAVYMVWVTMLFVCQFYQVIHCNSIKNSKSFRSCYICLQSGDLVHFNAFPDFKILHRLYGKIYILCHNFHINSKCTKATAVQLL